MGEQYEYFQSLVILIRVMCISLSTHHQIDVYFQLKAQFCKKICFCFVLFFLWMSLVKQVFLSSLCSCLDLCGFLILGICPSGSETRLCIRTSLEALKNTDTSYYTLTESESPEMEPEDHL